MKFKQATQELMKSISSMSGQDFESFGYIILEVIVKQKLIHKGQKANGQPVGYTTDVYSADGTIVGEFSIENDYFNDRRTKPSKDINHAVNLHPQVNTIHLFSNQEASSTEGKDFANWISSEQKRLNITIKWYDSKIIADFIVNNFINNPTKKNLLKTIMANYILEGIYFYSGFMFFYNLERNGKMPGSAQEIRYINRDENTHLWLFRNIIKELQNEEPELFTDNMKNQLISMMKQGVENEIEWGHYVIGDNIQGINKKLIEDYIKYLGNLRLSAIGLPKLYDISDENPAKWVDIFGDANLVKTDFFEAKSTAYAKASTLIDDL